MGYFGHIIQPSSPSNFASENDQMDSLQFDNQTQEYLMNITSTDASMTLDESTPTLVTAAIMTNEQEPVESTGMNTLEKEAELNSLMTQTYSHDLVHDSTDQLTTTTLHTAIDNVATMTNEQEHVESTGINTKEKEADLNSEMYMSSEPEVSSSHNTLMTQTYSHVLLNDNHLNPSLTLHMSSKTKVSYYPNDIQERIYESDEPMTPASPSSSTHSHSTLSPSMLPMTTKSRTPSMPPATPKSRTPSMPPSRKPNSPTPFMTPRSHDQRTFSRTPESNTSRTPGIAYTDRQNATNPEPENTNQTDISEYEKMRLINLAKNQRVLKQLGLFDATSSQYETPQQQPGTSVPRLSDPEQWRESNSENSDSNDSNDGSDDFATVLFYSFVHYMDFFELHTIQMNQIC